MSGMEPERLTIINDGFTDEAYGSAYNEWSMSDTYDMTPDACCNLFSTLPHNNDLWAQKYCGCCNTGGCSCYSAEPTRLPNVCGIGNENAERFGSPPKCSKGDRLPNGAKAWAAGLPDECFRIAEGCGYIGCVCDFRHRGCVVVAFLAEGKRRGWWS